MCIPWYPIVWMAGLFKCYIWYKDKITYMHTFGRRLYLLIIHSEKTCVCLPTYLPKVLGKLVSSCLDILVMENKGI